MMDELIFFGVRTFATRLNSIFKQTDLLSNIMFYVGAPWPFVRNSHLKDDNITCEPAPGDSGATPVLYLGCLVGS